MPCAVYSPALSFFYVATLYVKGRPEDFLYIKQRAQQKQQPNNYEFDLTVPSAIDWYTRAARRSGSLLPTAVRLRQKKRFSYLIKYYFFPLLSQCWAAWTWFKQSKTLKTKIQNFYFDLIWNMFQWRSIFTSRLTNLISYFYIWLKKCLTSHEPHFLRWWITAYKYWIMVACMHIVLYQLDLLDIIFIISIDHNNLAS